jgi:hypothetical protein
MGKGDEIYGKSIGLEFVKRKIGCPTGYGKSRTGHYGGVGHLRNGRTY